VTSAPPPRDEMPSKEDFAEITGRIELAGHKIEKAQKELEQAQKRMTSTPPGRRWLERQVGRVVLRMLIAVALAFAAGAGGWLWRDCLAHVELQQQWEQLHKVRP
jgi:hypothetical protein